MRKKSVAKLNNDEVVTRSIFKEELEKNEVMTRSIFKEELERNEVITRSIFKEEFAKELWANEVITRPIFKEEIKKEFVIFKGEILTEVHIMMHETLENTMENMKIYYTEEMKRHMSALREGFREDLKPYRDEMICIREKVFGRQNV